VKKILEVNDLAVSFETYGPDVQAIRGVSFELNEKETLAIVGESGSGKSVTAYSIMRLIPMPPGKHVRGSILFNGEDLTKKSEKQMQDIRGKEISMIFQDPMTSTNPTMKVGNQISEGLIKHQNMSKKEARQRSLELLKLVGIPNPETRINQYPHQYSGGMRQRAMIAIALACNPKILIADDEHVNLQVLLNQLSMEGYEVLTASNGEEVLKIVNSEDVDLVILDIMMPKMSGFEVCTRLRMKYTLTELPILMLTAKNQLRDKLTSFEVGANDYLTKPCDKEELLSRVKTLITLRKTLKELEVLNGSLEQKIKQRTDALEKANANLQQMEESRSNLLSSITHELGTPITLIHSYIQAVDEGLIKENNPYYLNMIHNKLVLLGRLTSDLFELAQLHSGRISFDFDFMTIGDWSLKIVGNSVADIEQSNHAFIPPELNFTEVENHFFLLIDRNRIDQVLLNVIWNAIEHTPEEGGVIEMSIDISRVSLKDSNTSNTNEKLSLIIKISDNGKGISEEDLPYIFDRYFKAGSRTSETLVKGTGLGLAIAKEIIASHNGQIWVESVLGEGSSFFIELPIFKTTTMKLLG